MSMGWLQISGSRQCVNNQTGMWINLNDLHCGRPDSPDTAGAAKINNERCLRAIVTPQFAARRPIIRGEVERIVKDGQFERVGWTRARTDVGHTRGGSSVE